MAIKGSTFGVGVTRPAPAFRQSRMPGDAPSDSRPVHVGLMVGALVGGLFMAEDCRRQECYVPAVPIAIGVIGGAGIGGLIGLLLRR